MTDMSWRALLSHERQRPIMQHCGHKKAVVAVARAMLVTAYHLLTHKTTYHNPGTDYYNRRHTERSRRRRRLRDPSIALLRMATLGGLEIDCRRRDCPCHGDFRFAAIVLEIGRASCR